MSLLVVGSIAFDAVKTPFGERERMLGGSAVHFSLAASFFTDVRVVGPVGDDFGDDEYAVLHERGVNTDDIEHVEGGRTFFWRGRYDFDLNKGYPCPRHKAALRGYGPTAIHRRSWVFMDNLPWTGIPRVFPAGMQEVLFS